MDKWFRGDDDESTRRSCPLCRGERETSIIKGLLVAITPLMSEEYNEEESSEDEFPVVNV